RFRKARLHRSRKNAEAPDSCQGIDFRGCGNLRLRKKGYGISKVCHPEPVVAKDLPRFFRLDCSGCGSFTRMPVFRPKCRATANTFDAFREILRPKNGLRMTVQGTGLLPVIFSLVFPQLLSVMPKKSLFLSSQHCERIFPPEDLYCQSRPLYKFHFRIKRHVTIFVRPRLEIIVC